MHLLTITNLLSLHYNIQRSSTTTKNTTRATAQSVTNRDDRQTQQTIERSYGQQTAARVTSPTIAGLVICLRRSGCRRSSLSYLCLCLLPCSKDDEGMYICLSTAGVGGSVLTSRQQGPSHYIGRIITVRKLFWFSLCFPQGFSTRTFCWGQIECISTLDNTSGAQGSRVIIHFRLWGDVCGSGCKLGLGIFGRKPFHAYPLEFSTRWYAQVA